VNLLAVGELLGNDSCQRKLFLVNFTPVFSSMIVVK